MSSLKDIAMSTAWNEKRAQLLYELHHEISTFPPEDRLVDAGPAVNSLLRTQPAAVRALAYNKLCAFPLSDVPTCWTRAFEEACLWEVVEVLEKVDSARHGSGNGDLSFKEQQDVVGNVVRLCDTAIIFTGAPGRRVLIDKILLTIEFSLAQHCAEGRSGAEASQSNSQPLAKRRRLSPESVSIPCTFSPEIPSSAPIIHPKHEIPRMPAPSLTQFGEHMNSYAGPMILTSSLVHWPALRNWQSPRYWLDKTHAGRRLVPVELGSTYTDEEWGQKIMTFRDYLTRYLLADGEANGHITVSAVNGGGEHEPVPDCENIRFDQNADPSTAKIKVPKGYLAQHDLLSQIPSLRNDILVPDYCFLPTPATYQRQVQQEMAARLPHPSHDETESSSSVANEFDDHSDAEPTEPMMNIWLGPGGTVSPAHTDPHENILCQVVGRKYVRLFPPIAEKAMYPMGSESSEDGNGAVNMQNTSRVDVGVFVEWECTEKLNSEERLEERRGRKKQERALFPKHETAQYGEGVLEAGEALYIPRGWWHYVESLGGVSCSVSFWWD